MPKLQGQPTNNNILHNIENKKGNSYRNTDIKLGLLNNGKQDIETVTIQSARLATTTKTINSGALPLNSLNQTVPSSATVMQVASTSASDDLTSTGAEVVRISGLNSDWNPITEDVTLNGVADVATTNSFLRINEVLVVRSNNGANDAFNIGTISINETGHDGSGNPNTEVYATIEIGKNKSTLGIYSVRAGYSFTSTHYKVTADTGGKTITAQNELSFVGLSVPKFNLVDLTFEETATNFDLDGIPNVPEKSDILISSQTSSGSGRCVIWWSGILFRTKVFPNAIDFT